MFSINFYKDFKISSGFGVDRGSYKHEGVDYVGTKKNEIYNLISGIVDNIFLNHKIYGIVCNIRSNPYFFGGISDSVYHSYCHMSSINVREGEFVENGVVIGTMGNTGNCYTRYDKNNQLTETYRPISQEEKINPDCNLGVHLHLWFYQECIVGKETKLLKELKKLKILSNNSLGDTHFYQWGKIIYAPRILFSYFQFLNKTSINGGT